MLIKQLTAFVINSYRAVWGKGPVNVKIHIDENIVFLIVKGALSPMENALLQGNARNKMLIKRLRRTLFNTFSDKYVEELRRITNNPGLEIRSYSTEMDYENDRQIFVIVLNQPLTVCGEDASTSCNA